MNGSQSATNSLPEYKSGFLGSIEESKVRASKPFWHPENPLPKGGTYEVLVSQGVDISKGSVLGENFLDGQSTAGSGSHLNLLTKASSCHDIWTSNQYCTPEWRPLICQSTYTVDYRDKYASPQPDCSTPSS